MSNNYLSSFVFSVHFWNLSQQHQTTRCLSKQFLFNQKRDDSKKNKSQYGRYRVAKQPSTETTRPPPRRQKLATHPSSQSLCLSEPAVHQHTPRVLLRQKLRCPFSKKNQKKIPSSEVVKSPKKRDLEKNHHLTYTWLRSQNQLVFGSKL